MEVVYEMIQDGDEGLIKLMMESEKMNGETETNISEWVEKTVGVLQENLGIDPDNNTPEVITEERTRTLHLAGIEPNDGDVL